MELAALSLRHFRNYESVTANFAPGVNVLLGENAQGKTNLLESIYVLALARSHRTSNDHDLINWQEDFAQVHGRVMKRTGTLDLELTLAKKGKKAKVNHIEQARLSSYIGQFNVILFAPEDLAIVKGAPAIRRRFMDMEFGQMSPKYLYNLSQYRSILKQRNSFLRSAKYKKTPDLVYLGVLSDQLAALGAEIVFRRITLLKELEAWAKTTHAEISQGREDLAFHYQTQVPDNALASVETIYQALTSLYEANQTKELERGTSLIGCQRDDLQFIVNGKDVSTFGSQGQQRTTALSVKLAEIDLMKQETGEYPVLLLDDVLSELDDMRQTHLLTAIQDKVQTFLTTTSISGITKELIHDPRIFTIDAGRLQEEHDV